MEVLEQQQVVAPSTLVERRRDRRVAVEAEGTVRMMNPIDRQPRPVRIADVSRMGMKLISPRRIEPGVVLQVRMNDLLIMGVVRHCTELNREFHVGVSVEQMLRRTASTLSTALSPQD